MSTFASLFKFGKKSPTKATAAPVRATLAMATLGSNAAPNYQCIYPPLDPGLPAVDPQDIIHGASQKIKRLAEIAGGTSAEFERLYLAPLRNLAAHIHLLPATPHAHYSGPAGLFNMCLDIALLSRQSAEGKIFVPEATIEVRHRTEGAWRYSAFIAGLLSQLHVPVGSMTVTSATGSPWPRYGMSIHDWLCANSFSSYHVVWHEKAKVTGAEGASLLGKIVPQDVMDWMASTDSQIIRDVNIAVTREMSASESILGAILKSVVSRVKEVDSLHQPSRFGRLCIGTQFEPHLLNAMRELLETGAWRSNEPAGPVFWGSDGLYVAWPAGASDVLKIFAARGLSAMPHSSVTLAELLGRSGLIISKEDGVWVHDIVVKNRHGDSATLSAMRFKDPLVLIGHLPLKALTQPYGKLLVDAQVEQLANAAINLAPSPVLSSAKSLGASLAAPVSSPEKNAKAEPAAAPLQDPDLPAALPAPKNNLAQDQQGERNTSSAVLAHVEDVSPGDRLPKDILTRLRLKSTDNAATALGMALEQALQYRTDRVKCLDWGVAICCNWLTDVAGFSVPDLASPLDRAGVIAKNPDSRSVALVSKVIFSDSTEPRNSLVLKLEFAGRVGMPVDAKA